MSLFASRNPASPTSPRSSRWKAPTSARISSSTVATCQRASASRTMFSRILSRSLQPSIVFSKLTLASLRWNPAAASRSGRRREIHLGTGAYAKIAPQVAKKSGDSAAGPYRIPNLKIDSYSVSTNKPPAGAFRGFGVSQSAWAVESHMDIIAAALKMDPLEIRRKNGYNEGDEFVTGETLRSVGLKECV